MPPLEILSHPDLPGVEIYLTTITPALAEDFLDKNSSGQRNLNADVVERYTQDMTDKFWMFSGAPILFDNHGNLIDGQHRLNAICESGQSQICLIVAGLDPAVMKAVDMGRKRTYASFLHMYKKRPSAGMQAAIIRAYWHWTIGNYGDKGISRLPVPSDLVHTIPTIAQMEVCREELEARLGLTVTAVAQRAQSLYTQLPKITTTVWGLVYLLLSEYDVDTREAFFHELLIEPKSPAADYPPNTLKNRLGRQRDPLRRVEQLHLALRAFKAWQEGKLLQTLSMPNVASWSTLAMPPKKDEQ